ncbi:ankyrin repeat domain-containing protein [bacterium RCC_150]
MIDLESPPAHAVVQAIHAGDPWTLRQLLRANPGMATARFGPAGPRGAELTLLHVATDRPGHYPHGAETVAVLVEAGAEVSAPCTGPHAETPLHWAASSNDVDALDALLHAGADIEAPGAVFYRGTPLADAVGFGQWQAARHLIEHGARITLWQAAALGLRSPIRDCFQDRARTPAEEVNTGFWYACRGGQFNAAVFLLHQRADLNWIPEGETQTPLDAARLGGAADLVKWLSTHGAKPAAELH